MDVNHLTTRAAIGSPVRALLELLEAWAFDAQDARARRQGWTVHRPAPLIRVYRNPRFDTMIPCEHCAGEGVTTRGACRTCLGSGRERP
ncbi:hypothetical protein [Nonomuraea roseola]|uniref:Uncharacterized protein n=1 Tax=Nonomuraea roseola TaxID=46179 RepID=A0ABV5PRP9_9ACTN